jgi:uncharacterized protein (DUF924 family)
MSTLSSAEDVLRFWFEETPPSQRFRSKPAFDQEIGRRFEATLEAAARCELVSWRETPQGRLAEIIVLDQFSRNLRRGSAGAFANDPVALALAQEAVDRGIAARTPKERLAFLYMPFMHSESRLIQETSVALFTAADLRENLDFALRHKAVIDQFGRFPHRNDALGRPSTAAEEAFLKTPGSRF